jgi:hypothetical protein
METPVEIRYAGVVVARANEVRRMTVGGVDLFLAMPEPLPAGTLVALGSDQQARIEKVIESADPSVAGVYVKLLSEAEASMPWVPCFREDEVPAPRPPAVVVSPIIVKPVHAPAPPRPSVQTPLEVRVEARPTPVPPPPVPAPPAPEPVVETPLPVVTADVVAPEPSRPFVAPMPKPNEQIALFDTPEPPPAVVENAVKGGRKRSTIMMGVVPPAERPPGAVESAAGEIDTGSRRVKNQAAPASDGSRGRPTIMVETDHYHQPAPAPEPAAAAPAEPPAAEPTSESRPTTELRIEDLSTARALPSSRGRATKRRKTTQR